MKHGSKREAYPETFLGFGPFDKWTKYEDRSVRIFCFFEPLILFILKPVPYQSNSFSNYLAAWGSKMRLVANLGVFLLSWCALTASKKTIKYKILVPCTGRATVGLRLMFLPRQLP